MRRTRASAATAIAAALSTSHPTPTEVVTIDDDGEQVVDVQQQQQQQQPKQYDSQKENIPITSVTTSAASSAGLFDKYRFTSADPTAATDGAALTKRKAEALPFTSKKRTKSAKSAKATNSTTADTASTSDIAPTPAPITFSPTMRHRSLAPLLPNPSLGHPPPSILIVGSAPSEASLKAQSYYAYKYNHFWPIVSRLFHFDPSLPYPQRVLALTSRGIAVWDVCREFTRKGSLDSNLRGVLPNDFVTLFDAWPSIRLVASNGGTSFALFRKHVGVAEVERRGMVHVVLPSSSPAHAMKNAVEEKTRRWREVLQVGDEGELLVAKNGSNAQAAVEQAEQGDLVEIED